MNRIQLIKRIAAEMRERGMRKRIPSKKHVFHISDDSGNQKDFVIRESDRGILYTSDDVESVIDIAVGVILDALKNGESVSIHGFGTLSLKMMNFGTKKDINTGRSIEIPSRFVPKFSAGNEIKRCAKLFSQMQKEGRTTSGFVSEETDEDGGEE